MRECNTAPDFNHVKSHVLQVRHLVNIVSCSQTVVTWSRKPMGSGMRDYSYIVLNCTL